MITSPTGKGVVLIGGFDEKAKKYSNALFELTGESIETLKWPFLEQKLQLARYKHFSFYIPNQLCKDLIKILK